MNLSIGRKMFFMGLGIVVALSLLAGASYFTSREVKWETKQANIRNEQLNTLHGMKETAVSLRLAAMDSLVRKSEGKINEENLETINNSRFLIDNLPKLKALADTDEEKQLAVRVEEMSAELVKSIKTDLVGLIEESGVTIQNIENEFKVIDDRIDALGFPD